jgi:hypothetical protein
MRGRVMALYSIVFIGSTPIGGPITGWLAGAAGPRAGLVLGGVAALVAGVVAQRAFARGIAPRVSGAAEAAPVAVAAGGGAVARAVRGAGGGGKSMHRPGLSIRRRHREDDNCTSNYFHPPLRSTDVHHRHPDHAARRNLDH